jgi:hypothetical protein
MISRPLRSSVSGILIVFSLVVAWTAAQRRIILDGSLASLDRDRIDLDTQKANVDARRASLDREVAKPIRDDGGQRSRRIEELRRNDPKMQALRLKTDRAWAYFKYAAFIHSRGLSPLQIAKFEQIIAEHGLNNDDINAVADEKGIPLSDPAIVDLQSQERSRFNSVLIDLLGPEGPEQLQQFDDGAPARQMADRLAAVLADSPNPVSPQQAQELVSLVQGSQVPSPFDPAQPQIDWNAAEAKAAGILSPAQMAEFSSAAALADRYQALRQLNAMYQQWSNSAFGPPKSGP